jgi:hypothetical protein
MIAGIREPDAQGPGHGDAVQRGEGKVKNKDLTPLFLLGLYPWMERRGNNVSVLPLLFSCQGCEKNTEATLQL